MYGTLEASLGTTARIFHKFFQKIPKIWQNHAMATNIHCITKASLFLSLYLHLSISPRRPLQAEK